MYHDALFHSTALHVLMLTEPKGTTSFPVCVLGSESSINTSAHKTLKVHSCSHIPRPPIVYSKQIKVWMISWEPG